MSYFIVKAVLRKGPQDLDHRLALLSIATFARTDGSACVPMRALVHRSTSDFITLTQLLKDLLQEGWITREYPAAGAAVYQLDLARLGVSTPPRPVSMVRRAIGSVLDSAACAHCGMPLNSETQAPEGTPQQ